MIFPQGLLIFVILASGINGYYYDWDMEIANEYMDWKINLVGDPKTIVSRDISPCEEIVTQPSNNNVNALIFEDRLFVGWRTAPTHFASKETHMHIVSAPFPAVNMTWEHEITLSLDKDMREPFLLEMNGTLRFFFFEAGVNPVGFDPSRLLRVERKGLGDWTDAEQWGHLGEIVWEVVVENGTAYSVSYSGTHYSPNVNLGDVNLFLNRSQDGLNWSPVGKTIVYNGGISEVGWYFDLQGNMWGVGRNEDGDESGWGSRTFRADKDDLSNWKWTNQTSNPWIFESPKMFRHGKDLYLVARTDPNGPFWSWDNDLANILPKWEHHLLDLGAYSLRPHGTAIWKLNQNSGQLEQIVDLAGCGDTALPSIVRLSKHRYIILNYSSPLDQQCPGSWIAGQISPQGTVIYTQMLEFVSA